MKSNFVLSQNLKFKHAMKPLFNDQKLLTLHHLYIYHTFIDTLKIKKYIIHISILSLFKSSSGCTNLNFIIPQIKLNLAKNNFVFQASCMN